MTSSPLLAEEEEGVPSLSSGPVVVEDSPLERLVAQPNPNPLAGVFSLHDDAPTSAASTPGRPSAFNFSSSGQMDGQGGDRSNGSSLSTLVAGSLCLLQIAFVWGSYLSKSWFDTHVQADIGWQMEYLPFLNGLTDVSVKSTTLPSIFSALQSVNQHAAMLVLILTALLIPCLCMVLCPVWTFNDHEDRKKAFGNDNGKSLPRIIFEPLVRLSLVAVYILLFLDLGTSSILWTGDANGGSGSKLLLYNRTQSGLVAYALGMCCALAVLVVLRVARSKRHDQFQALLESAQSTASSRRRARVPPPNAFLLPWRTRNSALEARRQRMQQHQGEQTEPLLSSNDNDGAASTNSGDRSTSSRIAAGGAQGDGGLTIPFFQKLILYEVGILSVLLWLPALFLPMFKISFEGIAAEFMSELSFQLRLWDLPFLLWGYGRKSGARLFVSIAVQIVAVGTVFLIPLCATALAVITFVGSTSTTLSRHQTKTFRDYLSWIHPALCGGVFALALFLTIPAFEPISNYSIDSRSAGLCDQIQDAINETCLKIVGHRTMGSWMLLAQASALELFVLLIIRWCRT